MHTIIPVESQSIQNKIYTIRDTQVMLDEDLAVLYGVEAKRLNEQVKRNIERFPEKFRFQLTENEYENLRSQIATLSFEKGWGKHRKYLPYVFTEQGVSMLSAVLKSQTAIEVSIKIIDTFVEMRKFISLNANIFQRFERVEQRLSLHDEQFNKIFEAIENNEVQQKQHIFYDGQIFDAHLFASDIIKSAKTSIKLLDNYIDESTLVLFTKRNIKVNMKIYTKAISKQLQLDIQKHNAQYPGIEVEAFDLSHDRFLIIDDMDVYHFGASLKDLGKKWFAVSKIDIDSFEMLRKLK